MDLHEVIPARSPPELSQGLNKRHALHITNCTTKLNDAHIWLLACIIYGYTRNLLDPFLDCICNVWDNLYGLAQVITLALAFDDVLVDLASGDIVVTSESDVEVAFIVAEIEIDFTTVGEDEDFTVPVCNSVCCVKPLA